MHSKNGEGGKALGEKDLLPLVQQYLGSVLFKQAHHYETVTSVHAQYLDFHHQKVPLAPQTELEYEERSLELLLMGSNPGLCISVQLLRLLQYGQALICLAMDELYPYNINRFVIIAIVFADRQAASVWANFNGYLSSLRIKNPYRSIHTVYSRTSFVVTRPENISVKLHFKLSIRSAEQIKSQANAKFREKLYQEALLTYEIGLGMIIDPEKRRQRAVLYANSSQCLFEMRLYQSALIYAEISSALDKKYVKAFFRKFTCLLQLRETSNIPQVLNSIRRVGTPSQFEDASQKYTKYLSNSIGFYDWQEMFSEDSCIFGQYYSNKLQKVKNEKFSSKKYSYRAYETINPYELIMVQKPLIYQNSKHEKFGEDYSQMTEQIKSYTQYESYFYTRFNQLPSQCLFEGNVLKFSKNLPQGIQINEIHSKCLRCLELEKTVLKASPTKEEYMGIWDNLYLFQHSCLSNCTYLHIKGCLVVFAITKIEKGEPLSIDFLNWETRKRNIYMKEKLGRICECAFCIWEWEYESGATGQFLYQFYRQEKQRLQQGGLDKIALYFLWDLIYLRGYNQMELMKEYVMILERYPIWQCVINCFRYLRSRPRNNVFDHIKSTLKRIFQRYFKLTHVQAVGLLKNIL